MKILFLVLILALPVMAQRQWPSHDHEQAQHKALGQPRRVKRTTPRIVPDANKDSYYAAINDCGQIFRGNESEKRLREMRREKRTCLREKGRGGRR